VSEENDSIAATECKDVFVNELQQIASRRQIQKCGEALVPHSGCSEMEVLQAASDSHLFGLAFSGGGIRSATFGLGILQGLAKLRLLEMVDYLSTVSGGGYIGSWLAAGISRLPGGMSVYQRQLADGKAATPFAPADTITAKNTRVASEILHLRRHTSYLAPRMGFLSADRWVLWALYVRNFLLSQLALLPAAVVVLLLSRIVMLAYLPRPKDGRIIHPFQDILRPVAEETPSIILLLFLGVSATCAVAACIYTFWAAGLVRTIDPDPAEPAASGTAAKRPEWAIKFWRYTRGCLIVLAKTELAILAYYVFLYRLPLLCYYVYLYRQPVQIVLGSGPSQWFSELLVVMICSAIFAVVGYISAKCAGKMLNQRFQIGNSALPQGPFGILLATLALLGGSVAFCYVVVYPLPLQLRPDGLSRSTGKPDGQTPWSLELFAFMTIASAVIVIPYILIPRRFSWRAFRIGCWCFVTGLIGGAALYGVYAGLHALYTPGGTEPQAYVQIRATALVTTFGPPLILLANVLAISLGVGLLKREIALELGEWWASLCARLLIAAAVWASVNLVALFGTAVVIWAGPWVKLALGSGWLLTIAGGVLAGGGKRTEATRPKNSALELFARFAFHVFVFGLLILVSLLVHAAIDNPPQYENAEDEAWPMRIEPQHPAKRETLTDGGLSWLGGLTGQTERRVQKEYIRAPDEQAALWQQYWLGMVNTEKNLRPQLDCYNLEVGDLDSLAKERLSSNHLAHLQELVGHQWDSENFEKALERILPGSGHLTEREEVRRLARKVILLPAKFKRIDRLQTLAMWLVGFSAILLLAVWRVDVNLCSLHGLYTNRLVRAYLGASRSSPPDAKDPQQRDPDPITGFDPHDDIKLKKLAIGAGRSDYDGPCLIINTTMNMVHSSELAWQERKAESFVLTAAYCGSETTRYRPTEDFAGGISLGTAVALSGAAASPNMGYHSSASVTALLTIFNARLGAWLGNPKARFWKNAGPKAGFWHLFKELFGWTSDTGGYVYLSDGGHFENLGVYELVRRRCRYIVVSDAGQDGEHSFEDLGNSIRKCRIDLGIPIEIELNATRLQGDPKRCRCHCAIGRIRYDLKDHAATPGMLVYLKPCLTGDEPADVLHYAESHPTFPHESTGNQFYTESQFESYRALGEHIADVVFTRSYADMIDEEQQVPPPRDETPGEKYRRRCRAFFSALERQWFAMPPAYESTFVEATKGFVDIQRAFREDRRLWRLSCDLYPELKSSEKGALLRTETPDQQMIRRSAELHVIAQMLQAMENAWLSLNLDVNYAHPLNRGWMDVFHRWTSAETVRRHWPLLRGEFGRGFVSFCEKQMRLGVVKGKAVAIDPHTAPERLARLCLEFEDQWETPKGQLTLDGRIERARVLDAEHKGWLVYPDNPYPLDRATATQEEGQIPAGVILVSPSKLSANEPEKRRIYDFLVWMRGAYRNTGLGRPAVADVLRTLSQVMPRPFVLRVSLPLQGQRGPGGAIQQAMWQNFFHHQDFVRLTCPDDSKVEECAITLERSFDLGSSFQVVTPCSDELITLDPGGSLRVRVCDRASSDRYVVIPARSGCGPAPHDVTLEREGDSRFFSGLVGVAGLGDNLPIQKNETITIRSYKGSTVFDHFQRTFKVRRCSVSDC
jgi:patatin-like phospholipase